MKKSSQRDYLHADEESLVVASTKIEGDHGLTFDICGVSQKLQNFLKAVKYQCGDYDIKYKSSMRYYQEVIKRVNKK